MGVSEICRNCRRPGATTVLRDGVPIVTCLHCDRLVCFRCGMPDPTGLRRVCGSCGLAIPPLRRNTFERMDRLAWE